MRGRGTTRERDDQVLRWVQLRARGLHPEAIARRTNYKGVPKDISTITDRVKTADLEEAGYWGDDPAQVEQHYWTRKRNRT